MPNPIILFPKSMIEQKTYLTPKSFKMLSVKGFSPLDYISGSATPEPRTIDPTKHFIFRIAKNAHIMKNQTHPIKKNQDPQNCMQTTQKHYITS